MWNPLQASLARAGAPRPAGRGVAIMLSCSTGVSVSDLNFSFGARFSGKNSGFQV